MNCKNKVVQFLQAAKMPMWGGGKFLDNLIGKKDWKVIPALKIVLINSKP